MTRDAPMFWAAYPLCLVCGEYPVLPVSGLCARCSEGNPTEREGAMHTVGKDTRPRCEHHVVYPLENCVSCLRASLDAERLRAELHAGYEDAALEVLEDVLGQACMDSVGNLDSLCLGAYADGLRYLAERGRVALAVDDGRNVVGRFTRREEGEQLTERGQV